MRTTDDDTVEGAEESTTHCSTAKGSRSGRRRLPAWLLPRHFATQHTVPFPAAIRIATKEQISSKRVPALFQMPRRCCHAYDSYSERALCLGTAHAEAALNETECPHCEDMSLVFLRSRAALFRARPRFSRPPALFLPGICEEKAVGQRTSSARLRVSSRRLSTRVSRPRLLKKLLVSPLSAGLGDRNCGVRN
ncbi:hypothetical protein Q8A67_004783 [Cirrhinus molitorella]|uniref:Uncharacterized protein n=1 Tax=Cirrhinus molitorella TaxID=172907 RepID=A0AA88PYT7_9TELE|nr:hypothetical protein Q8A67_004783 [Cirrhinus molitorella]